MTNHGWANFNIGDTRYYPVREGRTVSQEQIRLTKTFWRWRKRQPLRESMRISVKTAPPHIIVTRIA